MSKVTQNSIIDSLPHHETESNAKWADKGNMAGHNHGHLCGHEHHQHSNTGNDLGALYSLYTKIDINKVECLNEEKQESGKCVFKAWDKRFETHEVPVVSF